MLVVLIAQAVTPDTVSLADMISRLDAAALAILLIGLIIRGTFVTGGRFDEMREDRDWWRSVAMRALNVGEAAVSRRDDP